jgi:ubiquinone/menaquinone biosynthesis C-methylase UbiE
MKKITSEYIIKQYKSGVNSYSDFTKEIGWWDSEEYAFKKYLKHSDEILDLGCGTGRTTFPLYLNGYQNIIGVDLTPEMIAEANRLNEHFNTTIYFSVGDATNLKFENSQFDAVIFSFNGIMSIPGQNKRDLALEEINRVLKKEGVFIFTSHDRAKEPQFFSFWEEELKKWEEGIQNPRLHEFGDLITESKNETREIYIHIPEMEEVQEWLQKFDFEVIETFYRNEKFEEHEEIRNKSGECRFWIAKKNDPKYIADEGNID